MEQRDGETVVGVGVDLCDVAFFVQRRPATHAAFYGLAFTPRERAYCQQGRNENECAQRFAVCFAGKEAAAKALSGAGLVVRVPQVEVVGVAFGVVSRRGETVPDLREVGINLVVDCQLQTRNRQTFAIAHVIAVTTKR